MLKRSCCLAGLLLCSFVVWAQKDFSLDTLLGSYKLSIRGFKQPRQNDNIKAYAYFMDTANTDKTRYAYYFKLLPPKNNGEAPSYLPVFQDWENIDLSHHMWNEIMKGAFSYEQLTAWVLKQQANNHRHVFPHATIANPDTLIKKVKQQYHILFRSLVKGDYGTFVREKHPCLLNTDSYEKEGATLKEAYAGSSFRFTGSTIDSTAGPVDYFGEIQLLLYCTNRYTTATETGEMKVFVVASSFDNGSNWYFTELWKRNLRRYEGVSKGNVSEPPISPVLLDKARR